MRRIRHVGRYSELDKYIGGKILLILFVLIVFFLGICSPRASDKILLVVIFGFWILALIRSSRKSDETTFNSNDSKNDNTEVKSEEIDKRICEIEKEIQESRWWE